MKRAIIFLALILMCSGFIFAVIPTTPHGFYGNVYYSDGVLIGKDLELRAEIGEYETSCSLIEGKYDLVVESEDGGIVYFYIEGLTESIGSYEFESFAITELNFTTSLVNPNHDSGDSSGNGGSGGGGGSSGDGGGSGGGSFSSSKSTPNNEGVILLDESGEEEEEADDGVINVGEQDAGTGLGAVIGFIKSGAGIGLGFALVILVLGTIIFITQKRKVAK